MNQQITKENHSSPRPRSLPDVARELISLIGEDPSRPGIKKTPERFAKAISELTSGYSQDIDAIINGAIYSAQEHSGMVIVRDISFHSLCEHHLLPFHGRISVGYIPNEKIIGLSKIPRIVHVFSKRLQLQERLTREIAQAINEKLNPLGVGVFVRARHMCLEMRGAKVTSSEMLTSAFLGEIKNSQTTRSEFLQLINSSNA